MLPDLTGMLDTRIETVLDAELAAGVEHHHATDAAFHRAPVFTQLCSDAITTLTRQSVERGTARAVGHVGVELLLDGVLSFDMAARDRYVQALRVVAEVPGESLLRLRAPGDLLRLQHGIARLELAPIPEGFRDPDFVAARLRDILGKRPRLAMRERDFEVVRSWAHGAQPEVAARHQELLEQVRSGLSDDASARVAGTVAGTVAG